MFENLVDTLLKRLRSEREIDAIIGQHFRRIVGTGQYGLSWRKQLTLKAVNQPNSFADEPPLSQSAGSESATAVQQRMSSARHSALLGAYSSAPIGDEPVQVIPYSAREHRETRTGRYLKSGWSPRSLSSAVDFHVQASRHIGQLDRVLFVLSPPGAGKTFSMFRAFERLFRRVYGLRRTVFADRVEPFIFRCRDAEAGAQAVADCKWPSVVFLDALDEDPSAWGDSLRRVRELESLFRQAKAVVISCRTDFIGDALAVGPNGSQVFCGKGPNEVASAVFIRPFSREDVIAAVRAHARIHGLSRMDSRKFAKALAAERIYAVLMTHPLLLDYLAAEYVRNIGFVRSEGPVHLSLVTHLYVNVIGRSLDREATRLAAAGHDERCSGRELKIEIFGRWCQIATEIEGRMRGETSHSDGPRDALSIERTSEILGAALVDEDTRVDDALLLGPGHSSPLCEVVVPHGQSQAMLRFVHNTPREMLLAYGWNAKTLTVFQEGQAFEALGRARLPAGYVTEATWSYAIQMSLHLEDRDRHRRSTSEAVSGAVDFARRVDPTEADAASLAHDLGFVVIRQLASRPTPALLFHSVPWWDRTGYLRALAGRSDARCYGMRFHAKRQVGLTESAFLVVGVTFWNCWFIGQPSGYRFEQCVFISCAFSDEFLKQVREANRLEASMLMRE